MPVGEPVRGMGELARLLPERLLMFLGAWTASNLIDDNIAAAQATRAGARLAAELGNGGASGLTQAGNEGWRPHRRWGLWRRSAEQLALQRDGE